MRLFRRLLEKAADKNLKKVLSFLKLCGTEKMQVRFYKDYVGSKPLGRINVFQIDEQIAETVGKTVSAMAYTVPEKIKVGFLATEIYEGGGHTELILRMSDLYRDYEQAYFESNFFQRKELIAVNKFRLIQEKMPVFRLPAKMSFKKRVSDLYRAITAAGVTHLIVMMHVNDIVGAAVLALLKKHGNIKIIYSNHADHLGALGCSFCDVVWTGRKVVLKYFPERIKVKILPVIPDYKEDGYGEADVTAEKKRLGIKPDEKVLLSGFAAYKIFQNGHPYYWELIKRLLAAKDNLRLIFISILTPEQMAVVKEIFGERKDLLERVIFMPPTSKFALYVKLSDLFIDSFPMSSALTHIDMIRQGKPTIIKVNDENPFMSFDCYLYDDYEYKCHTVDEMYEKALYLLNNEDEYKRMSAKVKAFYEKQYGYENLRKLFIDKLKAC